MKIKNQIMKNVKIVGIVLSLQFCFSACSKNSEENEIQDQDPIIGAWYNFSADGVELIPCEQKTITTYNEDLTFTVVPYQVIDGNCVNDGGTISGTWSNKGNGVYEIKYKDGNDETRVWATEYTFSNDFNSFTAEGEDGYIYVAKRK